MQSLPGIHWEAAASDKRGEGCTRLSLALHVAALQTGDLFHVTLPGQLASCISSVCMLLKMWGDLLDLQEFWGPVFPQQINLPLI